MNVLVTSKNPVKIRATRDGFEKVFPDKILILESTKVDSGVTAQPTSDKEALKGALVRTKNAMRLYPHFDYYVGIEGGIERGYGSTLSFAWVVVRTEKRIGKARSMSFIIPDSAAMMINEGKELGEVMDIIFRKQNIKQKEGAIGLLTKGIIDRTALYIPAVVCALIPFISESFFPINRKEE